MQAHHSTASPATSRNLQRMFWLRGVIILVLASASLLGTLHYGLALPADVIAGAILCMLGLNAGTWWRLGYSNPVSDLELLTQLLLDIAILTGLFYATGGYTNPFVWIYLLPITVASVALPMRYTWGIALLCIACYSALMFWYQPLPMSHHMIPGMDDMPMSPLQHENGFSVHLLGMWAGFVVSAIVIAFFVSRMANTIREYDHLLADAREKTLESERMLALGSLAALAAHELGTPLSTLAVLAQEMQQSHPEDTELGQNLHLIRTQVDRCKTILSSLSASAGQIRAEGGGKMGLDYFLEETLQHWQDSRPATQCQCTLRGSAPAPVIVVDRTLGQALVNLLDNAADAADHRIDIHGTWDAHMLTLDIHDDGGGLSPEIAAQAGTPFFTTKPDSGLGLGLYLSRMVLGRLGGTISLENHPQGGTMTSVRLPLTNLLQSEP